MARRFDPVRVAEGALNRLCEGDPRQTAANIAEFQQAFTMLSSERLIGRVLTQVGLTNDDFQDALAVR